MIAKNPYIRSGLLPLAGASLLLATSLTFAGPVADVTVQSVAAEGVSPTDTDNDFTRINNAIINANANEVIEFVGTFDIGEAEAATDYAANGYVFNIPTAANLTLQGDGSTEIVVDQYLNRTVRKNFMLQGFSPGGTSFPGGVAITGLTFRGLGAFIYDGASSADMTISNNTIEIGNYLGGNSYFFWGVGAKTNLRIEDNTIRHIVNAGDPALPDPDGVGGVQYGVIFQCCSQNNHDGVFITGNTFELAQDPSRPEGTTNIIYNIFDNNNTNGGSNEGSDVFINNNTFDGSLTVGGEPTRAAHIAFITTGIDGRIDGQSGPADAFPGANYTFDGNSFINVPTAVQPFNFDSANPDQGTIMTGSVFSGAGYLDLNKPIVTGPGDPGLVYLPAIQNATVSAFGTDGGTRFDIDLATSVDGLTSITMLNAVALDPKFIEMEPTPDFSEFFQSGIQGFNVIDTPAQVFQRTFDDAWTFLPKWTRPTDLIADGPTDVSGEELAIGFNAEGNPLPSGDPDVFNSPPNDGVDPLIIDIAADTAFEPGTIVDKNVTIRLDPNLKFGATSPTLRLTSLRPELIGALFVVEDGGSLTIQDLTIDGDVPDAAPGIVDVTDGLENVRSLVSVTAGGSLTLENVVLRNSDDAAVNVDGENGNPATAVIAGSRADNVDPLLRVDYGDVTTTGTLLLGGDGFFINRGASVAFDGNTFAGVAQEAFFINRPDALTITNNLFFGSGFNTQFNGVPYDEDNGPFVLTFENNWHQNVYSTDADYVSGPQIVYNNDLSEITASGVRIHDARVYQFGADPDGDNRGFAESNIVAQLDRDLDAWPDVFELRAGSTTDVANWDTDGDGEPDGYEAANGSDPNNNASTSGGFVIDADVNMNGIADWYEDSLAANTGAAPFLGDILLNGGVNLDDAVRSLQIVNGSFGSLATDRQEAGDLNALQVTRLSDFTSLNNPLQILRFQALVRQGLPAVPGID